MEITTVIFKTYSNHQWVSTVLSFRTMVPPTLIRTRPGFYYRLFPICRICREFCRPAPTVKGLAPKHRSKDSKESEDEEQEYSYIN